jgi:outer membrane protein assembly factor BamB
VRYNVPYGPHHDGGGPVAIDTDDQIYLGCHDGYASWAGVLRLNAEGSVRSLEHVSSGTASGIVFDDDGYLWISTSERLFHADTDIGEAPEYSEPDLGGYQPVTHNWKTLLIDSEGRILQAMRDGVSGFVVARYQSNGSLDPTFGSGGFAVIDEAEVAGSVKMWMGSIALQSDGAVLMAGTREASDGNRDWVIARVCP